MMAKRPDTTAPRADPFAVDNEPDLSSFTLTPARKPSRAAREAIREASDKSNFPSRAPPSERSPASPPRKRGEGRGEGTSPQALKPTLKQRARQVSLYLEPAVYDALRDIAHAERTKLHTLILEGVDAVLRRRGVTVSQDHVTTGSKDHRITGREQDHRITGRHGQPNGRADQ